MITIKVIQPVCVTVLPPAIVPVDDRLAEKLISAGKAELTEDGADKPKAVKKTAAKKTTKK